MRITYLHYLYGADTAFHHARQFAAATRDAGHEITVHALNLAPAESAGTGSGNGARDWLKTRFSRYLHEPKELIWNAPYTRRILEILRAERPDVMVVRDHALTFAEIVARSLSGVPLVLEINAPAGESGRYFDEYLHVPGAALLTERWKVRRADRLTTVSGALKDYLVSTHGVPDWNITVNPNGADCEKFRPDIDPKPVRERWKLFDRPVIGFVGSLHPWHGPDLLKGLLQSLGDPRARFLLVGDGQGWPNLRDWVGARGLLDQVVFPGRVAHEEVPGYVAAMDVALIPDSNFYGSSLKTLEYMAAGRAIVAPRYGPFEEILEPEREGILFPPGDLSTMVASIRRLLGDEALRRRFGLEARTRVCGQYTWRHNADRVLKACREAVQTRHGSHSKADPKN
jgi:glycosyltransferase involved in cell wall biosynthesis